MIDIDCKQISKNTLRYSKIKQILSKFFLEITNEKIPLVRKQASPTTSSFQEKEGIVSFH